MKQIKYGAILSYNSIFLNILLGFLFLPFIIKSLGQAEYGLYSMLGSFVGYLFILDFGLSNCINRFISKYRAQGDGISEKRFLGTIVLIYAFITFMIISLGFILKNYIPVLFNASLNKDELKKADYIFTLLLINTAVILISKPARAIITAFQRFVFLKAADVIRQILRATTIYIVLLNGKKSAGIIICDTALNLLLGMIFVYFILKHLKVKFVFDKLDLPLIREISVYSFFIFLNVIAGQIYWHIDNVILGMTMTSTIVAINAVGVQISQYYILFSSAISRIYAPTIINKVTIGAGGKELTPFLIKVGRIQASVVFPIIAGFILFGPDLLKFWIGSDFQKSYTIAVIIMIPMTILLIQNSFISILEAKSLHYFRSVVMFITSILNIFLTFILVQKFGILGAPIATALGLLIGNIVLLNIYYSKVLHLQIQTYFNQVFKGIGTSVIIAFITSSIFSLWRTPSLISLFLHILVFSTVYLTFLFIIGLNPQEKCALLPFYKTIAKREL